MSETSTVTGPIVKALNQAGYFAMRLNSGEIRLPRRTIKMCPPGTADILICLHGRLPVWIETKDAAGKTNKEQKESQGVFRDKVERLGHTYAICHDLDAVLRVIAPSQHHER